MKYLFRYETSAKEDINITKAIRTLVQHILDNDPEVLTSDKENGTFLSFYYLLLSFLNCDHHVYCIYFYISRGI